MEKFSPDPFFNHEIKVSQPETGYRFSMDPFILAAHIQPAGIEKIVDIGCGCAIMPLILALRWPGLNIIGVEIQKELSGFARQNIIDNRLESTIRIIHEDINNIRVSDINGPAGIIISNPPYIKKDSGRLNPDSQKAIARHEITLDIDMLFYCSNRLLQTRGRLYVIFPADRLPDLVLTMERYKYTPDFIRFVHIKKNSAAKRVILCAMKNSAVKNSDKPCVIHPPFYIYASENRFSHEYVSMFRS
ncbi:tRNA1(Val) (adenine(37)-N6)-methyltransferase [Desulfobacula sp.]|uniref:tRNA1(Val) (adenine(37)-N6)-methyltransferase n=1 Tax=Desulfobacula sp. TaxID=2593537 RepID=UPI0027146BAC|nr:methyltransferase [Desulfobacula sp.]